jgi:hypothetical protein
VAEQRCPHGFLRSVVPCTDGCDAAPEPAQAESTWKVHPRRRPRRRRAPMSVAAARAARPLGKADVARMVRLEPLLLEVAQRHGLQPADVISNKSGATEARSELAAKAKAELMMSPAEISKALRLNQSTIGSLLARRAS